MMAALSLGGLIGAVVVVATGLVGFVRARDVYGRLHYGGPVNFLGPVAVTVAVASTLGLTSPVAVRGVLIVLLLTGTGPIVAHATARAARLRRRGTLDVHPEDAGAAR